MERTFLKIGLIQQRGPRSSEDPAAVTAEKIERLARQGAKILCLQELFHTPYFCIQRHHDVSALAEKISGPLFRAMARVARKNEVVLIVPFLERGPGRKLFNAAAVIDADGSLAGHYRKMHLPWDPHFYEKEYFTEGDRGFQAVPTRYARIGVLICWDQWFLEAARVCALGGAEILFYPSAIGWQRIQPAGEWKQEKDAWETIQRSHAIANGLFVASVNRTGREGPVTFWGSSFVADPLGKVLARAGAAREETLVVSCDLRKIREVRRAWPLFRDRRPAAYRALVREGKKGKRG